VNPRPRYRRGLKRVWGFQDETDPRGLVVLMRAYLDATRARHLSEASVRARESSIGAFILFCQERGITRAHDVTRPVLERYQRQLVLYRKHDGLPLSTVFQHGQLTDLKLFFRWLVRSGYLLANPASELELPKLPQRLPDVLSLTEVELLLSQPDLGTPVGIRDRAILEVFYSTAMRRKELTTLKLHDVDFARGQVTIRQGKGRKDRVVPIGERALRWLDRYLLDVRPHLATEPDDGTVFLTSWGEPVHHGPVGNLVKRYLEEAGIKKHGACHLLRHTAATLMLEGGADLRFIQQLLGHASIETTEIYTHVSIQKLKEIHAATHPGARLRKLEPEPEPDPGASETATAHSRVLDPGSPTAKAEDP
jgi:integrase/recombinase XerD